MLALPGGAMVPLQAEDTGACINGPFTGPGRPCSQLTEAPMRIAILALLPLTLAACADKPPRTAQTMIPAGEPRTCVQINQIRSTQVIDDQTIDFRMQGGQILRNTLPNRCPGLGFERAFSYRTSIAQLCNVDIITVVVQGAGPQIGASCGLGVFQPVKPAPADTSAVKE